MDTSNFTRRRFIKTSSVLAVATANMSLFSGLANAEGAGSSGAVDTCPPYTVTWTGGPKTINVSEADCKKNGQFCCRVIWRAADDQHRGSHWGKK